MPLDTCINNTRHSVFFLRADWFLYFSVLRKLLCEPPNWIFNTGFYATKPNILLYIYIYKGEIVNPGYIRLFIFATIYTRVPFTGYFSTFEEESRRSVVFVVGRKKISFVWEEDG